MLEYSFYTLRTFPKNRGSNQIREKCRHFHIALLYSFTQDYHEREKKKDRKFIRIDRFRESIMKEASFREFERIILLIL